MGLVVLVLNELVADYLTNAAPQQFHYNAFFLKKQPILLRCNKIETSDTKQGKKTSLRGFYKFKKLRSD
jgi:hypothetical protein